MGIHINFKICDNSADCNGIKACPTGAFHWDDAARTIRVDNAKCINCGKCVCCSVDAVRRSKTDAEAKAIEAEYAADPRTLNDLFTDRFGASPIVDAFCTDEDTLDTVLRSPRPFMVELYTDDTVECLLKSIPVKELLQRFDPSAAFRKVRVTTDKLQKRYGVTRLPALVFIRGGRCIGHIDGYVLNEDRFGLFNKIKELVGAQ